MIFDSIINYQRYLSVHPRFIKAFDFLIHFDPEKIPLGRIEIDGDEIYASFTHYTTVPAENRKWEGHRKYIDIQYVASGREIMGWKNDIELPFGTEYNEEKDCVVFEGDRGTELRAEEGCFAIFFPEDLHRPQCVLDKPEEVYKIIIKVAV